MWAVQGFDWERAPQLSLPGVLFATFAPSAVAFVGFHAVVPALVRGGVPVLVAWPAVATAILAPFSMVAIALLRREAVVLGLPLAARACLRIPDGRTWIFSLGGLVAIFALALPAAAAVGPLCRAVGFEIPTYLPFFLNPAIDPRTAPESILSPGLPLAGRFDVLALLAVTLFFNILTEELYFRAWMLPKLARHGAAGWVANGVLFALYHTFQIWLLPVLLVGSLGVAWVCQFSRSIWPAAVIHTLLNLLSFGTIAALVLR
jgi:membrane protease YdiL (CAAX protease family)